MSSRFEGLPMVLLEAQSYGLPIIAFDCDTGPSDLIENNKNGYLVESGNVKELANTILNSFFIKDELYKSMVEENKKRNVAFKLDTLVKNWIELI